MISFRVKSHRFHLRAGAVAIEDGHVLLHRLEGDTFWALPGGRVEAGEESCETLIREFKEELDLTVVCGELLGTGENFFEYGGEPHHEIGMYLSVEFPAGSLLKDKTRTHCGIEGERRLEFRWFPLGSLLELDFRPKALRDSLHKGRFPSHFVQRG